MKKYKRILIPTDGSPQARKGVRAGLALAKGLRAHAVGLYVRAAFRRDDPPEYGTAELLDEAKAAAEKTGKRALASFARAAKAARVRCSTERVLGDTPWKAILEAAREHRCDLIVAATRGASPLRALVRGSETASLLAHASVPVLVVR